MKSNKLNAALQEKILTAKTVKGEKPRIKNMARWLSSSDNRMPAQNIQHIILSNSLPNASIIDTDPRERVGILEVDNRFSGVISKVTNGSIEGSWAAKMTEKSLGRFYGSLANVLGDTNEAINKRKDVNIGTLFDALQAQEIGMTMKVGGGDEDFKINSVSELSLFMNKLLEDKSVSQIARKIFSTAKTVSNLSRYPEKNMLTTLFRVLDQMDVKTTAYDRRLDNEYKPSAMSR